MAGISSYAVVIVFDEEYFDDTGTIKKRQKVIQLDAVSDIKEYSSNTITTYPIVSGDFVADHAYKNPSTLSFNGSSSFKGHKTVLIDGQDVTPVEFVNTLKSIKDNAYLCKIYKIGIGETLSDVRFMTYNNYVITNMSTTEKLNTIDFGLSWQQVLLAEIQTLVPVTDDEFLPNIEEPKTTSVLDTIISFEDVLVSLIDLLVDKELISIQFIQLLDELPEAELEALINTSLKANTSAALGKTVSRIVSAVVISKIIKRIAVKILTKAGLKLATKAAGIALAGSTAFFTAGVSVVVFLAVDWIESLIKANTYIQPFNNRTDLQRFGVFVNDLYSMLESLNSKFVLYQIGSNENQELMIGINDGYFVFTFSTNNTTSKRQCVVTDPLNFDTEVAIVNDISSMPTNIQQCASSSSLFTLNDPACWIHILNLSTKEFNLNECYILVCNVRPEEYNDKIKEILNEAIRL